MMKSSKFVASLSLAAGLVLSAAGIGCAGHRHPRVYDPYYTDYHVWNDDEVTYYRGMIAALDQAQAQGRASVIYDGEHIDIAHVKTAREIIAFAESIKR